MNKIEDLRVYDPDKSAVFCKTKDKFGGNSNMAGGFPLVVNDVEIRTSEALFQACRFPWNADVQKKIIEQSSPMHAKMVGKPFRGSCNRPDWEKVMVTIMKWCLRVKLLQNWEKFSFVLLETGNLPIVELSNRGDDFWGAVVVGEDKVMKKKRTRTQTKYLPSAKMPIGSLVGYNIMGRLNMELRKNIKAGKDPMSNDFTKLLPLSIPDFLLYGQPIREILRKED